jgi:hypothetical protein
LKLVSLTTLAVLLGNALLHTPSYAAPVLSADAYEVSSAELDRYCIERLCLGMTPQKVATFGAIKWLGNRAPDGKVNCNKGPSLAALGELETSDGTKFHVRFELVTPFGQELSRYRLMDATIQLKNVTLLQADKLAQELKDRYGPMREFAEIANGPVTLGTAASKSGLFKLSVTRAWNPIHDTLKVGLSADYKHQAAWVLALPECRVGLPKI